MKRFIRIVSFPATVWKLYNSLPAGNERRAQVYGYVMKRVRWRLESLRVLPMVDRVQPTVDKVVGVERSNQAFSYRQDWIQIGRRLSFLEETHPEQLEHFVEKVFEHNTNPIVIGGLAQSKISRNYLRAHLKRKYLKNDEESSKRIKLSQNFSCGLIFASHLLLDEVEISKIVQKVKDVNPFPNSAYEIYLDSFGYVPSAELKNRHERGLGTSGFLGRKKHRLIIVDRISADSSISILTNDADNVTIFQLADLYGRTAIKSLTDHGNLANAKIAYARTKMTRFSSRYQQLHKDTQTAAEQIISALNNKYDLLMGASVPYAELKLADTLFFPALIYSAVKEYYESDEFDHIVFAIEDEESVQKMSKVISGIVGLENDPRVEFVSLSSSLTFRTNFQDHVSKILATPNHFQRDTENCSVLPQSEIAHELFVKLSKSAKLSQQWQEGDKCQTKVMMITNWTKVYGSAGYSYFEILHNHFNLLLTFVGSGWGNFYGGPTKIPAKGEKNVDDLIVTNNLLQSFNSLHQLVRQLLIDEFENIGNDDIRHIVLSNFENIVLNGISSSIVFYWYFFHLFEHLKSVESLPEAVVVIPFRSLPIGLVSSVSREFGVPSLALESIGLNASYCRYSKIATDYYGTISSFFCEEAAEGFGMTRDRCFAIGSPRLIGELEYDRSEKTTLARAKLEQNHDLSFIENKTVITFLSQPSKFEQISEVWRMIIEATETLDVALLLKTHPEETEFRQSQFLSIVEEMNASERTILLNTDIETTIEASDIMLTCYSAAAVEATLMRRPVFCVTNGDEEYPLKQHEVIRAPMLRTVDGLMKEIASYQQHPESYYAAIEKFLETESQFVSGPEEYLVDLIKKITSLPSKESVLPPEKVPQSLFLDGPFDEYRI